ncbi:MAG: hypothetical protein GXO65_04825 [Euryarchaeota archaeon]|nr:hypothetical protein [Euryarchaeota archaeon]
MRPWVALLVSLLLIPGVQSQGTGLYVEEHNLTYTLGLDAFHVEEVITFVNRGDPFTFEDTIYLRRGDARNVEVTGISKATVEENYPGGDNVISFFLVLQKGNRRTVTLNYDRSDLLSREATVRRFNAYALGQYPWLVHQVNIKFITPQGYSFGPASPEGQKAREGKVETLTYSLSVLRNLTEIRQGVLVDLRYANYRDMAIQEISAARRLTEEAGFDLESANRTLQNAAQYGDVTNITGQLEEAGRLLEDARAKLEMAVLNNDDLYRNHYQAYVFATQAEDLARSSSKASKQVEDQANYLVQRALEEKVSRINEELSTQSALLNEKLSQPPVQPETGGGAGFPRTLAYLAVVFAMGAGLVMVLGRIRVRPEVPRKKSSVSDYRDIDELKRKTFNGFEKKVDTVKKGVELATKIRELRNQREKLALGIENLRKKRVAEEITEETFREDKAKMETRLEELDSQIVALEEELKELKQVRR